MKNPKTGESEFIKILDEILFETSREVMNISIWNGILSLLKQLIWLLKIDFESRARVSDIWYTATFRVAEKIMGNKLYERLLGEKETSILYHICQKIITMYDLDMMTGTLYKELPKLGIKLCYISLFEKNENDIENDQKQINQSRLIFAYNIKKLKINDSDSLFLSSELLPGKIFKKEKNHNYFIDPLYFGNEMFGFIIFELDTSRGLIYSTLGNRISSSIKGAYMFRDQEKTVKKLSETVNELEKIKDELVNLQKSVK